MSLLPRMIAGALAMFWAVAALAGAVEARYADRQGAGAIEYFGGSVFSSVEVVSVIWGPDVSHQTVDGMPGFLKAVVDSTYMDQLAIYDTKHLKGVNGHRGSNQKIGRGTFYGQVQITPRNQQTSLTDRDIRRELEYQIAQGNLPAQTPNTFYMIYFPPAVVIEAFGYRSCTDFDAYHFATSKHETPSNIFYSAIADCGSTFEYHTIVSSAQLADAATDNIETRGSNPDFPQAWEASDGFEIGDFCYGIAAKLGTRKTTYYVQEIYLDSIGGCSTASFTSP